MTAPAVQPDSRVADPVNIADIRMSFTDTSPNAEIEIQIVPVWGGLNRFRSTRAAQTRSFADCSKCLEF